MAYDDKDLIIYDRAYHLCLWIYPATLNYPRKLRGLAIQTANLATQILLVKRSRIRATAVDPRRQLEQLD